MGHVALQQVVVRMLYDPRFRAEVFEAPAAALAGVDVTGEEKRWLLAPDHRAWRAQSELQRRALSALIQEYPASVTLALRAPGGLASIDAFFSDPTFHACVETRGWMAVAFGDYLRSTSAEFDDARLEPVAGLEQAIVRLRAGAALRPPPAAAHLEGERLSAARRVPGWHLSPDKTLTLAASGTAALHAAIYRQLDAQGEELVTRILDMDRSIPATPVGTEADQPLILELARDQGSRTQWLVGIAEVTEELAALLARATPHAPPHLDRLIEHASALGADPTEAPEIVLGLIEEGTLVPAPRAKRSEMV